MGLSASIIRVDMNSYTNAHGVTRPQFLVARPPSLILMKEEETISETSDCKSILTRLISRDDLIAKYNSHKNGFFKNVYIYIFNLYKLIKAGIDKKYQHVRTKR
jgi:hypothetical protein